MDKEINNIIKAALKAGIVPEDICKRAVRINKITLQHRNAPFNYEKVIILISTIVLLLAFINPNLFTDPKTFFDDFKAEHLISSNGACIVSHSAFSIEITRPISKCSLCNSLDKISIVHNITKEYFLKHHAYTGVPVLIKNVTTNWTAIRIFSFQYFRKLYDKLEAFEENDDLGCQFFPYKTDFKSLKQVLYMNKKIAKLQKDIWYIGWSNCVPRVTKILRKHYNRPTFLPDDSESSQLDWMFMGGTGTGADMHIDAVNRPSWQAMIKGRKTWFFEPPPECEYTCKRHLNVTMEPGDILVVDTNRWYHSTYIHAGNLSITIGSEYD